MDNYLQEIKEKIRTINPEITDELLDLLYEFFELRQNQNFHKHLDSLKQDKEFVKYLQNATLGSILGNTSKKKY